MDLKNDVMGIEFEATKFEAVFIQNALRGYYEDGWIEDVLYRVKGGKEATVYCCRATPETGHELLAAKIYRPRQARAMRNYGAYREGRRVTGDKRLQRAIQGKTRRGRVEEDIAWVRREFDVLRALRDAGADVPDAVAHLASSILMTYVGDETGAAPLMNEVRVPEEEARRLFDRVIQNIETMLSCDLVHGDLSPFNVMYWRGDVTLIDFPQAIVTTENANAFGFLLRDVERICRYFEKSGLSENYFDTTERLWQSYTRRVRRW